MSLSDQDRKRLWAKAGNRCSYQFKGEICKLALVRADGGTDVVVGEECHIIGEKPGSARHSPGRQDLDSYENRILLCSVHHKLVDGNEAVYAVDVVRQMKRKHEAAVSADNGGAMERLEIADSEFITEVADADRAVGMEVNTPASLSNVKSTLKATNVKEAIGFSTNQGLTGSISSCPHCGGPVQAAYTGPPPTGGVRCPRC